MENKFVKLFKLEKLMDSITGYLEARFELFKVEAKEEVSQVAARAIHATVIGVLLGMALLLLSVSGCIFLGVLLDNYGLGFLIGGGAYFVLGILLYLLRNQLPLKDRIYKYLGTKSETKDE